jgi:hypothetical protein
VRRIDRAIGYAALAVLALSVAGAIQACTAHDRTTAARTALDAVDQADKTCADLREVLHPDAGSDGAP